MPKTNNQQNLTEKRSSNVDIFIKTLSIIIIVLAILIILIFSTFQFFPFKYYKSDLFSKLENRVTNFDDCVEKNGVVSEVDGLKKCRINGLSFTEKKSKNKQVSNFLECKNAGGEIQESFPEVCIYQDKSFTKEILTDIKPLVANEKSHLVVFEKCDLSIKYNRQIIYSGKRFYRQASYLDNVFSLVNLNDSVLDEPSGIDMTCNQEVMNEEMYDLLAIQKPKKEICQILNLTPISCERIDNPREYLMTKNYTPNRNTLFKFTANNNEYRFLLGYLDLEQKGLENIQIQFNSLAPSIPTIDIEKIQENSGLTYLNGVNFIYSENDNGDKLLQKEDPDGYYLLKISNKETDKINQIGEMYKIWGKLNTNREIVEIDEVIKL